MTLLPAGVKVHLAFGYIDMRKGINGLVGEMHLRRALKSYADYYNSVRTHRSLNKDAPVSRPVQPTGVISSRAILADFITTMAVLKFSVQRGRSERLTRIYFRRPAHSSCNSAVCRYFYGILPPV